MTRAELKSYPGFADWVAEGRSRGFLQLLAESIDEEVGDTGYANAAPHLAHINLGVQDATRRIKKIVADPLAAMPAQAAAPPATYGVNTNTPD